MRNSSFATIFNRVTFVAREVLHNQNMTLEEIDSKWRNSCLNDGSGICRKKLSRDRNTIYELYGINIKPKRIDKDTYVYFVENYDKLKNDTVLKWTFSTLSMLEIVSEYHHLRERIFLEDYSPDPDLLPKILQAMDSNKQIIITYKRFTDNETKIHSVEPFFIKDYNRRLYLVARINNRKSPCVFSLDRLLSIETTDNKFKMPNLTPEEFFEDAYGVMVTDKVPVERIRIRAFGDEMFYIATKPLHHSQETIGQLDLTSGFCEFTLCLRPTLDFIGYLLSRADRIEVLRPAWLRKAVQKSHNDSASLYAEMSASDSPSI